MSEAMTERQKNYMLRQMELICDVLDVSREPDDEDAMPYEIVSSLLLREAEYRVAYANTMREPCLSADDRKHCACVPHLRKRVAELEAENRALRGEGEEMK